MLTSNPNLSESLCLLGFELGWVFANTTPTLHQHPTQWVSVSAVASILACWSVSTCRWGVGGVLVGSLSNTPPTESPVYKGYSKRCWLGGGCFIAKLSFFALSNPKVVLRHTIRKGSPNPEILSRILDFTRHKVRVYSD